jgi:hypothetical protein
MSSLLHFEYLFAIIALSRGRAAPNLGSEYRKMILHGGPERLLFAFSRKPIATRSGSVTVNIIRCLLHSYNWPTVELFWHIVSTTLEKSSSFE